MEQALGAVLSKYSPLTYPATAVIPKTDYPQQYESPKLPITNQIWVGRCVSESVCACAEEYLLVETGEYIKVNRDMFYQNRVQGQYFGSGMMASEACDNLRHFGVVRDSILPDLLREFQQDIAKTFTQNILDNAYLQHAITTARVANIDELKNAMSKPKTTCFSVVPVYESFYHYRGGIMPLPNESTEKLYGYHAIKNHGYGIEAANVLTYRNSWGTGWGEQGYFHIPENYPIIEMWAITDYTPQYDILEIFVNKPIRLFNGEQTTIDVAPFIQNGRTVVPARHTHEPFGDIVKWNEVEQKITIMRAKTPRV